MPRSSSARRKTSRSSCRATAGRRLPASLGNLFDLRGSTLGRVDVQLGKPARLDDARFSPEAAAMGMWQPLRFMKEGYAGIYFLEPYAADKTPVLFVHGIGWQPARPR